MLWCAVKAKHVTMIGLLCWAAAGWAADPGALPPAVKKTLETAARGEAVHKVTSHEEKGRTVYTIELERRGSPNPQLRIAADGSLLHDSRHGGADTTVVPAFSEYGTPTPVPSLKLEELPTAAQETIRRETKGRELGAIRADTVDGRTGYLVELRERGRNARLYVAEDGTVLRPAEKPPALMIGTTFSDLPVAAQNAIRRAMGAGEILRIDKEGRIGEPKIYQIDIRDPSGAYELRIAENGRILHDSRTGAKPAER